MPWFNVIRLDVWLSTADGLVSDDVINGGVVNTEDKQRE